MPNSKQIVYLSQAQYAELISNGSITVDGVTVNYNENDIYVTPQAEPVTDVRVAGTSVAANGVAEISVANGDNYGVIKVGANAYGLMLRNDGTIQTVMASNADMKGGSRANQVISPQAQHLAAFYGLAKAAGHDEKDSTEPLGTYTPEAKGAIQSMLGVSDLIATAENNLVASKAYAIGDVFTANGKLYKATAAIAADGAIITDGANANCEETSVGEGFVKKTDYATTNSAGIVKILPANGITIDSNKDLAINYPTDNQIKNGAAYYRPIVPALQHKSVFYGLAKAAGDITQSASDNAVGAYTDEAKAAIKSMIGVNVEDVQINGTSITTNGIANIPMIGYDHLGVAKLDQYSTYGIGMREDGNLQVVGANDAQYKTSNSERRPVMPTNQHKSVFYGLAKAAGDTTQAASDNAVGTYTDDAKSAIRGMLGAVGSEDYATSTVGGVVKVAQASGAIVSSSGTLTISRADSSQIKNGGASYNPIVPGNQHESVFYGLAKASGDTTQSASSNAVGAYTDNAKASIKAMLGIQDGSTGTVDVSGTTPTITAVENTRYVCGEVTSLNFTPPASGISIVRFTSGSTVTVLTIPNTVKFPEWFDPTSLETNTIYEICVTDGEFGAVMSWPL